MNTEHILEIARVFNLFAETFDIAVQDALAPTLAHHAIRCEMLGITNILE